MKQPCLTCGRPADGTRCPVCTTRFERGRYRTHDAARRLQGGRPQYGGGWSAYAAQIRATATRCWICDGGPRANDPWQADHITPVFQGGGGGQAAAAHRSCNIGRANALRAGKPDPAGPALERIKQGGRPAPPPTDQQRRNTNPATPHTQPDPDLEATTERTDE